jgi:rfaE bifunctional protein nucleotidyltransferase chain/domain
MVALTPTSNLRALAVRRANWRRQGQRVVLTNGCFDLLHGGHVALLDAARREGDVLIVALNSDRSVREIKGPTRPVLPEQERTEALAALESVDAVVLFDEPTPAAVIEALVPDVLVKGADWESDSIVGSATVEQAGGRVVRVPLVAGRSTSALIERIRRP